MTRLTNARHEVFAQNVAKGLSADEAYAATGYRPHRQNAHRLMTNEDVKARVAELQAEAGEKVMLDKAWVLKGLAENYRRAMQHQAVLDENGEPLGAYRYEGSVANRSLELIGKHLGMFNEKPQETTTSKPNYEGSNITDLDTARIKAKGRG